MAGTPMPTGAKAMAAACFAVVGWITAHVYVQNMDVATSVGRLREITALLGAIIGWRVMGNSVGKGYLRAIGSGWKTMVVLVIATLLAFALLEMLELSVRMRYDGPLEAILDVFQRMLDRSFPLATVPVLAVMLIGGGIAGMLAENANRRWR
jgi:hypothetical protein